MHVVGGSGAGKTTLLQNLILHDLHSEDRPALIIIDSQGDLINKISRLALFDPDDGPLAGRLVLISPKDIKHPPAVNIFDVNRERLGSYGRAMDKTSRRSRMRRTRTGKRIELTARDLEIFRALARCRYLSSTYIHAFVGGASETRLKERLGDLFHEGYLDRPAQQWQFAGALYRPTIYEAGDGARRVLCDQDGNDSCTFLATNAHRQFAHSMMICEVLASLEIGARHDPSLRFIGWPEILSRAPEDTRASATPFRMPMANGGHVVPDGMFGLEYANGGTKTYRFFALEADRGTMPVARSNPNQTSYLKKVAAYRDIITGQVHKTHWGIPNLLVLTLTTGEARMAEMLERLDRQAGGSAAFLFRAIPGDTQRQPVPQLLTEPWQRAGLRPFRIDESDLTHHHFGA